MENNKKLAAFNPQVFFAAERTLLAWQRSSISFIALGFVIERFGIFIKFLKIANSIPDNSIHLSTFIGIFFIVMGAMVSLLSVLQYKNFLKTLPQSDLPDSYFIFLGPLVSYTMFFAAIGLATWLMISNSFVV
ncbi:DUF202 domain-containing protein [Polynucleobacter asymbioticus]|uniref:YidH family protein n=1 Tax=Polynucleobacter asymbioticus TaxID=576611 RepID=UPI001BFE64FB|nr:DUF202 domain-containing protein [Polynucleobacter asymbioticus]QWD86074.1 DUF202 domain-containing protein [Polynucleobacter asymbioticus]